MFMDETPNGQPQNPGTDPSWGTPNPSYPPPPAQYPPPAQASGEGLSDNAAGALAYITIIPAIIFLIIEPYNQKPFVKFHAFQCLGLAVTSFVLGFINIIPILGQIIFAIGMLALFVLWVLCVLKASQGNAFKLPVIGDFAAQQSGYQI
jgi:uncharacterized membrane protein